MTPRLVLLSDHGAHGQMLARALAERGIALEAVVFHSKAIPPKSKEVSKRSQRAIALARSWWGFQRAHKGFYSFLRTRVLFAGEVDSQKAVLIMRRLRPDYILVGSGTILKPPLIETASCGVLNVHPGLLPWARGSGTVGHSLYVGVPVGATLHYIDAGIDTGAIIERRLLPITESQLSLPDLEKVTNQMGAKLMMDAVEQILREGNKPPATAQTSRFPLFRWPDAQGRRGLNELALSGRALELFDAWKAHTSGEPDWTLPPHLMESPTPLSFQSR